MPTLTLQPGGAAGLDTHIISDLPTTNNATTANASVGEHNAIAGRVERTLIKFDLSSLPSDTLVTAANLTLTITSDQSDNARTANVFECLRAWVEAQATWNIWKTSNNWTTAGAGSAGNDYVNTALASASYTASETVPSEKVYTFNAAGLAWIQAVAAGTQTNNGWIIRMQTELNDGYGHGTSDHATPSSRPKLIVEYTQGGAFFTLLL